MIRNAERRANRKSPMTPSQAARKPKANPKRPKREQYDETSYHNAIYRACDRVFPPQWELARRPKESVAKWLARLSEEQRRALTKWRGERRWHPNQLRHTAATAIRREHGIEAARVILGHSKLTTTEIYAAANQIKTCSRSAHLESDTADAVELKLFLVKASDLKTSFTVPSEATADGSLRRLQKLKVTPGATVYWAFGSAKGEVKSDAQGIVPVPGLKITSEPTALSLRTAK